MARRVPLHDIETAIKTIEQDGGVILTDFSSIADVEQVNKDAAPFIVAINAEVSPQAQPPQNQSPPSQIQSLYHPQTKQLT